MPNGYIKFGNSEPVEVVDATARSKMHEHTNSSVLDRITTEKVRKWDEVSGSVDVSYNTIAGNNIKFNSSRETSFTRLAVSLPLTQDGSGEPSPSNVRAFVKYSKVSATVNGTSYESDIPEDSNVYVGEYDMVTGEFTATWEVFDLSTKTTGWNNVTAGGLQGVRGVFPAIKVESRNLMFACSHFSSNGLTSGDIAENGMVNLTGNYYNLFIASPSNFTNSSEMNTWAKSQKANGTPVMLAIGLETPTVIKLSGTEIQTIAGENTVSADGNIVELKYPIIAEDAVNIAKESERNVAPLAKNISAIMPSVKTKYISHIGVYQTNSIAIPCQSIADIERAKRLGFDAMEINLQKTKDGKYVCLHGNGGDFGAFFQNTSGTLLTNVAVNSMTLDEIKQNVRYVTMYERYKTAPFTLEEICYELKKFDITPLVGISESTIGAVEILDSILGINNYMLATYRIERGEIGSDAPMFSWLSEPNSSTIISYANKSNNPYVAGINVSYDTFSGFTKDSWREYVKDIHDAGYKLNYAYPKDEQQNQILLSSGFDYCCTSRNVNDFECGNVVNIVDNPAFEGFTTTGSISGGILTLAANGTVSPSATIPSVFLGKVSMHITFSGKITVRIGNKFTETLESDGKEPMWFSTFIDVASPTFTITAVNNTTITQLSYKASSC